MSDSKSVMNVCTAATLSSRLGYTFPSIHHRTSSNTGSAGFRSGMYGDSWISGRPNQAFVDLDGSAIQSLISPPIRNHSVATSSWNSSVKNSTCLPSCARGRCCLPLPVPTYPPLYNPVVDTHRSGHRKKPKSRPQEPQAVQTLPELRVTFTLIGCLQRLLGILFTPGHQKPLPTHLLPSTNTRLGERIANSLK